MSLIARPSILKALAEKTIEIYPPPEVEHIGPNSVDLHLYHKLRTYTAPLGEPLDASCENKTQEHEIGPEGFVLQPHRLYLGSTIERTKTRSHVPFIVGRSSTGRLGISIHQTAGLGDIGFEGTWTLEISVVEPVRIKAGMRICQIAFFKTDRVLEKDLYKGRYTDQADGPVAYRGHLERSEY